MVLPAKPQANPLIVLREEFDDWAILFDPDTGNTFGLNPVSVFIWKRLDGRNTTEKILDDIRRECTEVPDNAEEHLRTFLEDLVSNGLVAESEL